MTRRRKRCPICQSTEWHKEPASGLITCSEGHVLRNYINENHDSTELGPHAMRKRTIKSQRKVKDDEDKSAADPRLYHGQKARFIYFQCAQLILRKQIASLAKIWDLPPEFETICKDLWIMHLAMLPNPPPLEPWLFANERAERDRASPSGTPPESREPGTSEERTDLGDRTELEDSGSDDETRLESEDPVMSALLREASESSSSDDEEGVPEENLEEETLRRKRRARNQHELPIANVAILALACWTMRFPITYMDLIRLIESYALPYLEAIRLLPNEMVLHLNKYTTRSLSPPFPPSTLTLHAATSRLARLAHLKFEISFPELNAAPVLWRIVQCLQGPPTLYSLTKSLATTLFLPLTLHPSLSPHLHKKKERDPKTHHKDNIPPELALGATAIIVLKLIYGLDGVSRAPSDPTDPALSFPSEKYYIDVLQARHDARFRTTEELFSPSSSLTALDLSNEQIDKYLEFAENALLFPAASEQRDRNAEPIAHLFPLEGRASLPVVASSYQSESTTAEAPSGPAPLPTQPSILPSNRNRYQSNSTNDAETSQALEPGSLYPIYAAHDIFGSLPPSYELVLDVAARWVGVDKDDVGSVVEKFEKRAEVWWKKERRNARERERERARREKDRNASAVGGDLRERYDVDVDEGVKEGAGTTMTEGV